MSLEKANSGFVNVIAAAKSTAYGVPALAGRASPLESGPEHPCFAGESTIHCPAQRGTGLHPRIIVLAGFLAVLPVCGNGIEAPGQETMQSGPFVEKFHLTLE